jgi:DNA topoisomerase-1
MLKEFYKPFHATVEDTEKNSERASGERILGKDPKTGKPISVRIGRFGPMVQMGETKEDGKEKPRFASLRKDQRLESMTLEMALDLFKLPRMLGQYEGKDVVVSIGRFGPYIKYDEVFYSLPKEDDPYSITLERVSEIMRMPKLPRSVGTYEGTDVSVAKGRFGPYVKHKDGFYSLAKTDEPFSVTLERAIELIEAKRKKEREKLIKEFPENTDIKVINGRYGPCIQLGKKFFKIPGGKDPKSLTLEECLAVVGPPEEEKKKGGKKAKAEKPAKKAAPKKAAAKKTVKNKKKKS